MPIYVQTIRSRLILGIKKLSLESQHLAQVTDAELADFSGPANGWSSEKPGDPRFN